MRSFRWVTAITLLGVSRWEATAVSRLPRRCCAPDCGRFLRLIAPGERHHRVTVRAPAGAREAGGGGTAQRRLHRRCRLRRVSDVERFDRFDRAVDGVNTWVGAIASLAVGAVVVGWVIAMAVGR